MSSEASEIFDQRATTGKTTFHYSDFSLARATRPSNSARGEMCTWTDFSTRCRRRLKKARTSHASLATSSKTQNRV
jgi:hypothetical protein